MNFLIVLWAFAAAATADVSHLSNNYLPPYKGASSAQSFNYESAPVETNHIEASAPAPVYSNFQSAPDVAEPVYHASAPAPVVQHIQQQPAPITHSYHAAASAPVAAVSNYQSYESAAPVQVQSQSYETAASEPAPAHSYSAAEGYKYKTNRRVVYRQRRRRRRDVSHLPSTDYLPPAASAPVPSNEYLPPTYSSAASAPVAVSAPAPVQSFSYQSAASVPQQSVSYQAAASAPVQAVSYETETVAESAPAHSYSAAEGYKYKTNRRVVYRQRRRRRRDVSHLPSTDYLPPAASAPVPSNDYLPPTYSSAASAPVQSFSYQSAASVPQQSVSYQAAASAPVQAVSYETETVAESAPAHSYSAAEGYKYKTNRRVVYRQRRRRRRDVSHLPSTDYLPPAASAPVPSNDYLPPKYNSAASTQVAVSAPAPAPVQSFSYQSAASVPQQSVSYQAAASAPVQAVSHEIETVAESAPAHTYSAAEGYKYKTNRRVVYRRHRK